MSLVACVHCPAGCRLLSGHRVGSLTAFVWELQVFCPVPWAHVPSVGTQCWLCGSFHTFSNIIPPLLFWALIEHLLYASHKLGAPVLLDRLSSGFHNAYERVMPGNLFKATQLENCHRQDSSPEILQCFLHRPSTREDKKGPHPRHSAHLFWSCSW